MAIFINNKNSKRIIRRSGGKNYVKYRSSTSTPTNTPTPSPTPTPTINPTSTPTPTPTPTPTTTSSGIIISGSISSTPRALVGGGTTYNPTYINSDYRQYFNNIVNPTNACILNGTLPLQNILSDSFSYNFNSVPTFLFDFRIPTVITKYRMWNGFLANYGVYQFYGDIGNQTPQAWILQGSNDEITWTTVDSRSGQSRLDYATSVDPTASPYSEYTISSPAAYKAYKLVVSSGGRTGYSCDKSGNCRYDTQIGEVQLWGYESPTTPCALHGYNTLLPTVKYLNSSGVVTNSDTFACAFNMATVLGLKTGTLAQIGQWMSYPNPIQVSTGSTKDGYLGFDYPITLTAYKMWADGCNYSFKVYGSNTFGSWTLLDTRTLVAVGSSQTFSIASPASYSYYKVSITNSSNPWSNKSGSGYYVKISDIQLQGYLT